MWYSLRTTGVLTFIGFFIPLSAFSSSNYPPHVVGKLYAALEQLQERENWLSASELLREILQTDLNADHLVSSVQQQRVESLIHHAKMIIDREMTQATWRSLTFGRVVDIPYLEAVLDLREALMAFRVRFNHSYDREVELVRNLLQSYFFPGYEEEGEILFPVETTYAASRYARTRENLDDSETAPADVIEDPRYPSAPPGINQTPEEKIAQMERVLNELTEQMEERERQERERNAANNSQPPAEGTPPRQPGEVQTMALEELIKETEKLYNISVEVLQALLQRRKSLNRYEPLALLLTAVSIPQALEVDPQLKAFVSRVRLKMKVAEAASFEPEEHEFLRWLFPEEDGVELTTQVDSKTGQTTLYLISDAGGLGIVRLQYFIFFKNILDASRSQPVRTAANAARTATPIISGAQYLSQLLLRLQELRLAQRWYLAAFGKAIGGVNLLRLAISDRALPYLRQALTTGKTGIFINRMRNSRVGRGLSYPAARYYQIALAATLAADVTQGFIEWYSSDEVWQAREARNRALSRAEGTLFYIFALVSKKKIARFLGGGAFALDFGHFFYPDTIPDTAELIRGAFVDYIPSWMGEVLWDSNPVANEIDDFANRLGIASGQWGGLNAHLERAIASAEQPAHLNAAWDDYSSALRQYAHVRLFFIHYFLCRWPGETIGDFGSKERGFLEEYEREHEGMERLKTLLAERKLSLSAAAGNNR